MGKKEKIIPLGTRIERLEKKLFQTNKPILVDTYFYLAQLYLQKTNISPDLDTYQYIELILNKCNELDENPIYYNLIGEIHLRQNNLEEAEKAFQKAFDINPTTIETHPHFDGQIREKYISAYFLSEIYLNYFSKNKPPIFQNVKKQLEFSKICQILDPTDNLYHPIAKNKKLLANVVK